MSYFANGSDDERIQSEIFRRELTNAVIREVNAATDDASALRIVLIHLSVMWSNEEVESDALHLVRQYLLSAFPPLLNHFSENQTHSFCLGHSVKLFQDPVSGMKELLLPKELMQALFPDRGI